MDENPLTKTEAYKENDSIEDLYQLKQDFNNMNISNPAIENQSDLYNNYNTSAKDWNNNAIFQKPKVYKKDNLKQNEVKVDNNQDICYEGTIHHQIYPNTTMQMPLSEFYYGNNEQSSNFENDSQAQSYYNHNDMYQTQYNQQDQRLCHSTENYDYSNYYQDYYPKYNNYDHNNKAYYNQNDSTNYSYNIDQNYGAEQKYNTSESYNNKYKANQTYYTDQNFNIDPNYSNQNYSLASNPINDNSRQQPIQDLHGDINTNNYSDSKYLDHNQNNLQTYDQYNSTNCHSQNEYNNFDQVYQIGQSYDTFKSGSKGNEYPTVDLRYSQGHSHDAKYGYHNNNNSYDGVNNYQNQDFDFLQKDDKK